MFEWLTQTDTNDLAVYGTGLATFIASGIVAWRGVLKGKPTSEAAMKAIAGASCSAPALSSDLGQIKRDIQSLHRKMDKLDDIAVRLEDRSRR